MFCLHQFHRMEVRYLSKHILVQVVKFNFSGIVNDSFDFFPSLLLLVNPAGTKSGPADLVPAIHTPDICQILDMVYQVSNILYQIIDILNQILNIKYDRTHTRHGLWIARPSSGGPVFPWPSPSCSTLTGEVGKDRRKVGVG